MTGKALKVWRQEKGWSQETLARKLKVRAMTVSRWETGAIQLTGLRLKQVTDLMRKSTAPVRR